MLRPFLCRELETQGIQDIRGIGADLSLSLYLLIPSRKIKAAIKKKRCGGADRIYGNKKRMEQKSYKNR